jgi:hypothetical protein
MKKNKKFPFILTKKEQSMIKKAKTFTELVDVGLIILNRMNQPIVQVCGPISTGGTGSAKENLKLFSVAINFLNKNGLNVFNQLPFERAFDRIMKGYKIIGYDTPILEEFYKPIFKSGKIKRIYLLPRWEKSVGARWEYNCAKKLGIKISKIPDRWLNRNNK